MSQDINVIALVKGEERYVFLFDDNNRAQVLRSLGRYASNPDLSFTWYDAAVLSQKIRQTTEAAQADQAADSAPSDNQTSRFSLPDSKHLSAPPSLPRPHRPGSTDPSSRPDPRSDR